MNLNDNHIAFTSAADIHDICQPLVDNFGLTQFTYVKTYKDQSQIKLSSDANWLKFFYENIERYTACDQTKDTSAPNGCLEFSQPKIACHVPFSSLPCRALRQDLSMHFNSGEGVVIVNPCKGATEFYFFGAADANHQNEINLLNNVELLHAFCTHFKKAAQPILKKAAKDKIRLPDNTSIAHSYQTFQTIDRQAFMKKLAPHDNKMFLLTKREVQCIEQALHDKGSREIGEALQVSSRTVEKHFENAKKKLLIKKTATLLEQYSQHKAMYAL